MKTLLASVAALFLASLSAAALYGASLPTGLRDSFRTGAVERDAQGVVRDAFHLRIGGAAGVDETARRLLEDPEINPSPDTGPELILSHTSHSLMRTHMFYQQTVNGLPILDAGASIGVDSEGHITTIHNRLVKIGSLARVIPDRLSDQALWRIVGSSRILQRTLVVVRSQGALRYAERLIVEPRPFRPRQIVIDLLTGAILSDFVLGFEATGRVFDPSPVEKLNDVTLRDLNDSAAAVPPAAYSSVDMPQLPVSGPLMNARVQVIDTDTPFTTRADAALPLEFDRADPRFEEVMVYYHLDRSHRYIESLGFAGARRVVPNGVKVDAHAEGGADNSHYVPARIPNGGALFYGDGGVDDAEDPDIILHEFGHAIHDSIAPGAFEGAFSSQARALAEAIGDYWAFSSGFAASRSSGRDPFCIGDWDARCGGAASTNCEYPPGSDCLRRVDSLKTMSDYVATEASGTEHRNGTIYSSALRQFFMAMTDRYGIEAGRRISDRIVLESLFGMPPAPTFRLAARKMIEADSLLYSTANSQEICAAMRLRGVLTFEDCDASPKGELTLFQSPDHDVRIPDVNPNGISLTRRIDDPRLIRKVLVQVDLVHPFRGDLRLSLIAPDGTVITLQEPLVDGGSDIHTTYGIDGQEAFAPLIGKSAQGVWTLRITDTRTFDEGRLLDWSLLFQFEGDEPNPLRPVATGPSRFLPVVARVQGAEGTEFVSDLRLFNGGAQSARVTVVFTPSGLDGTRFFSALKIDIAPTQVVTLENVVGRVFRTAGMGSLQIQGDVENLVSTSRTYNASNGGTFGQLAISLSSRAGTGMGDAPVHLIALRNNDGFRTNVGLSEISGQPGTVRVTFLDRFSQIVGNVELPIDPYSQLQFPALGGREGMRQDSFRGIVTVTGGTARVLAYGTVIDNRSGDPFYVAGVPVHGLPEASHLPTVIHVEGAAGTRWRSDVILYNHGAVRGSVALTFLPTRSSDGIRLRNLELSPGELIVLDDVVMTLFGLTEVTGQLRVESAASGDILVASRTWTPGELGTYGQFVPGLRPSESLRIGAGARNLMEIESSADFRTNAGIAEVLGAPATVRFRLFDGAGLLLHSIDFRVSPLGHLQFNLAAVGAPRVRSGRLTVEVVEGDGGVLAYATVIDNRTGDPIYVAPE